MKARRALDKSVMSTSKGADTTLGFMLKLAAGRFIESPFDPDVVAELTTELGSLVGASDEDMSIADGQALRLRLIALMLRNFGDPDWDFYNGLGEGVPLGVGVEMPRTPRSTTRK